MESIDSNVLSSQSTKPPSVTMPPIAEIGKNRMRWRSSRIRSLPCRGSNKTATQDSEFGGSKNSKLLYFSHWFNGKWKCCDATSHLAKAYSFTDSGYKKSAQISPALSTWIRNRHVIILRSLLVLFGLPNTVCRRSHWTKTATICKCHYVIWLAKSEHYY